MKYFSTENIIIMVTNPKETMLIVERIIIENH